MTTKTLFESFYLVPDFQREYVWKKKQVTQLLRDVYGAFTAGEDENYFLGSVVVYKDSASTELSSLFVVDGQQRLATMYLLFCAMRDKLGKNVLNALDQVIADADITPSGDDVLRHRLQLQYKASNKVLHGIGEGAALDLEVTKTQPGRALLDAYGHCTGFIEEKFGEDDLPGIKKFVAFVLSRIEFIRITCGDFQSALTIFEVLNYRGIVLNAMDLLKNLMFRVSPSEHHAELVESWDSMLANLRQAGETKPMRFLRYFLVANFPFDKMPRASELFDWILSHDDVLGYSKDPLEFVRSLELGAFNYANFLTGANPWDEEDIHLVGISYQKTGVTQHLPLLLAGAAILKSRASWSALTREVEALVFAYALAGAQWNDIEQVAPGWCTQLRRSSTRDELDRFLGEVQRKTATVAPLARDRLVRTNEIGAGLLKYTLAKLTQTIEDECGKDDDLDKYFSRKVTIEHILPQHPSDEAARAFGEGVVDSAYRIGNLVLLYGGPNSIARNKPFLEKRKLYAASDYELTKSLVADIALGKKDKTRKTAEKYGLEPFAKWNTKAIRAREEMLFAIASDIWGI